MSIGENIKKFRLEKGWTQKKLGEECMNLVNDCAALGAFNKEG